MQKQSEKTMKLDDETHDRENRFVDNERNVSSDNASTKDQQNEINTTVLGDVESMRTPAQIKRRSKASAQHKKSVVNEEIVQTASQSKKQRRSSGNKKINDKDLIKSIKEVKRKNNFIMREDECFVKYKNPTTGNTKLSKFIVGYNKKEPAYSMYNPGAKNVILPPIGRQKIIDLTKKGIDSDGGDENDEDEDEENRESDDKEEG